LAREVLPKQKVGNVAGETDIVAGPPFCLRPAVLVEVGRAGMNLCGQSVSWLLRGTQSDFQRDHHRCCGRPLGASGNPGDSRVVCLAVIGDNWG